MDRPHVRRCSAGRRTTSSGRCCGSAPSATRWRSSTTSGSTPTYVGHLAAAVGQLLELPFGVYHVAADGDCTWAEFAEAIFEEAGSSCRVRKIASAEWAARARRAGVLGAAQREAGNAAPPALARRPARLPRAPGSEATARKNRRAELSARRTFPRRARAPSAAPTTRGSPRTSGPSRARPSSNGISSRQPSSLAQLRRSRAGSGGRGPGRSGTIVFSVLGLPRQLEHRVGDLLDRLLDARADVVRLADSSRGRARARWHGSGRARAATRAGSAWTRRAAAPGRRARS